MDCRRAQAGERTVQNGPLARNPPAVRAAVRQQAAVPGAGEGESEPPGQLPAPAAGAETIRAEPGSPSAAPKDMPRHGPASGTHPQGPSVIVRQRQGSNGLRGRPGGVRDGSGQVLVEEDRPVRRDAPELVPGPLPDREVEVQQKVTECGAIRLAVASSQESSASPGSGTSRIGRVRTGGVMRLVGSGTAGGWSAASSPARPAVLGGPPWTPRRSSPGPSTPGRDVRRQCGPPADSHG